MGIGLFTIFWHLLTFTMWWHLSADSLSHSPRGGYRISFGSRESEEGAEDEPEEAIRSIPNSINSTTSARRFPDLPFETCDR